LKEFQKKDPDLALILPFLTANEIPPEDEIFSSSKAAKKYWINREMIFLDNEGIMRNFREKGKPRISCSTGTGE
jgi:hypothetical protein